MISLVMLILNDTEKKTAINFHEAIISNGKMRVAKVEIPKSVILLTLIEIENTSHVSILVKHVSIKNIWLFKEYK